MERYIFQAQLPIKSQRIVFKYIYDQIIQYIINSKRLGDLIINIFEYYTTCGLR